MKKLIEDAGFQRSWISFAILGLLEYSFAFWGRQDIVLLSWAILWSKISEHDFFLLNYMKSTFMIRLFSTFFTQSNLIMIQELNAIKESIQ